MIKLNLAPDRRVLGQFAWVAAIAFPALAAYVTRGDASWYSIQAWHWNSSAVMWIAAIGVVQLVAYLAGVRQLTQALFVVLMVVAWPIGFLVSHVLIALVFYVVFTPIALVFRLTGRDTMGRKRDPAAASYWHDRGAPKPSSSYFKLY